MSLCVLVVMFVCECLQLGACGYICVSVCICFYLRVFYARGKQGASELEIYERGTGHVCRAVGAQERVEKGN